MKRLEEIDAIGHDVPRLADEAEDIYQHFRQFFLNDEEYHRDEEEYYRRKEQNDGKA